MRRTPSINVGARLGIALGVAVAMLIHATAAPAKEGELRWRLYESGDQLVLAVTDTDGGTDALGSLHFICRRGSGSVDAISVLDNEKRVAIADVLQEGNYPKIEVGSDGAPGAISEIRHSDIDGWQLVFQMSAISKAFDRLRDTGVFEFRVGKANFRASFNVGLDQIAEFQKACKTSR
jgi:hypothetical protein